MVTSIAENHGNSCVAVRINAETSVICGIKLGMILIATLWFK